MGVVYKAEDIRLGRFVALKFLPDEFAADVQALERFRREARAASALNHPNICTLYDIGEQAGRAFIVMELLEGFTLRQIISEKGALPLDQLVKVATDVAEALEAAHARGILHRDIKPANILITHRGPAKLLDFGLAKMGGIRSASAFSPDAKASDYDSAHTGGWALGTIAYMSPEQALGKPLDERTDLFSFGTVLYEMATGVVPFRGDTTGTLFLSVVQGVPASAMQIKPDLPEQLQEIIGRCLEKDREKRYQHATDVLQDLRQLQLLSSGATNSEVVTGNARPGGGKVADDSRLGKGSRGIRSRGKKSWKVFAAGLAVIAIALGVFTLVSRLTAAKLTEKDTIILADFTNTTGEPVFDRSLKQAARLDLEQSPFLNVLSDREVIDVLKQMNRPANQRLTNQVAREVCIRSNSKAFIAGSIARGNSGYQVSISAISCLAEKEIAKSEADTADRSGVLRCLGKADDQLRRKLGESLPSLAKFNRPLEEATTSSLEALQAFTEGTMTYQLSGHAEAIPYFRRAIELDPNFARAYSSLGSAYYATGQNLYSAENFRRAYELRHRVSDRERFSITANYLRIGTGQLSEALKTSRDWVRYYSNDYTAYHSLGLNYLFLGENDKSAQASREAIQLAPGRGAAYTNAMLAYTAMDRYDEAKAIFNLARARNLDSETLRLARFSIAFLENDSAGMQEQVKWAEGKPGWEDRLLGYQAAAEAYYGRYARSRELINRAQAAALRDGAQERSVAHKVNAAAREAEVGNTFLARKLVSEALTYDTGQDIKARIAFVLAKIGDNAAAEQLADQLHRERPLDTSIQNHTLPIVRAIIELNQSHPDKSIAFLPAALPFEPGGYIDGMQPAYLCGLAYLQAKKGQEAAAEFQKLIDHPGELRSSITAALARLQLARANELSGNHEAARRFYEDFLALWKDADPDIPIFKQAKAEYAKLK